MRTWMRQMVDAAAGSGSGTEGTDDADQVVHVDPEHHDHENEHRQQLDQSTVSPSVQPTGATPPAITRQEITATTNGQPSVLDDLFSKFTLASEKNEVKHGAAQRQRIEDDRADPAMQNLLGNLMAHSGSAAAPRDTQGHVLGESSVRVAPERDAAHAGEVGKQEKQQALMNKLMSSLGATPSKPSPSDNPDNYPPATTFPHHLQSPSKQSLVPAGHGFDQSPRMHHPYSTINGAGLPVPTHNPALAGLTGHAHPGLTQPHFHGPLPPQQQQQQHMAGSPLPVAGTLSHVTSNLLNILTPPRPTGATQFPHPSMPSGHTGRPPQMFGGNTMPDPSQNFRPPYPDVQSQHPNQQQQQQHPLFGLLASPQPPMAQTQPFSAPPPRGGQYTSHGPLPGPIQLPLHSGQPELNRILPYQMLPAHHAHAIETNNGYPMHGPHPPPPQFQQLHPAQMFSPPHQPASIVQAHPLLSLLNPRPGIHGIGSPPTTSAKTADGLLAMLVGNGRHEGGNG
ncbi:hypothetical protein QFC22_003705 [Naganishia vaughanmartiniae]|uniref:Uncharacterized protein n=1 Tax=Naganishia vaughanmartiniae TaxID=1424756 RepID=A0ACC2X5B1_9TREE|nr:hypothetical protein QFC22_003705 [Naganishia vaughanmartiniae]